MSWSDLSSLDGAAFCEGVLRRQREHAQQRLFRELQEAVTRAATDRLMETAVRLVFQPKEGAGT